MKCLALIPAIGGAWGACMIASLPPEGPMSFPQIALLVSSWAAVLAVNLVISGLASRSGDNETDNKGE